MGYVAQQLCVSFVGGGQRSDVAPLNLVCLPMVAESLPVFKCWLGDDVSSSTVTFKFSFCDKENAILQISGMPPVGAALAGARVCRQTGCVWADHGPPWRQLRVCSGLWPETLGACLCRSGGGQLPWLGLCSCCTLCMNRPNISCRPKPLSSTGLHQFSGLGGLGVRVVARVMAIALVFLALALREGPA